MKKIKTFFGAAALSLALIGALGSKASTKFAPYWYYNTSTGVFVQVPGDPVGCAGTQIQCLYANTAYPIYASASFASPFKHN